MYIFWHYACLPGSVVTIAATVVITASDGQLKIFIFSPFGHHHHLGEEAAHQYM